MRALFASHIVAAHGAYVLFNTAANADFFFYTCNALSKQLGQKLSELEKCAEEGKAYRRNLTKQAIKYSSLCLGKADGEIIKKMCDSLDIDSLKSFTESLISKASEVIPLKPQLEAREDAHDFNNNEFIF